MKTLIGIVSSMLTVLMFASAAQAIDAKILSGAACDANSGSQQGDFSRYSTGVTNNASSNRWVTCPVVRDNTPNTNGISAAWVRHTPAVTMGCYFDSVTSSGSLSTWDYNSSTGSIYLNINSSPAYGSYAIMCSVPSSSRLISYRVEEY